MSEYNINSLAIPLFLFFMLMEWLLLKWQGKSLHRFNDSVTSLSMGMCLLISDALLKAYTFAIFIYLYQQHRWFDFDPTDPVTWLVFFLGVDLCYYWFHRMAHQLNVLWGAHVGHHQSEEYNLTTALRQSAFQYAFSWVFYLPLAILGCPPEVFLLQFIFLKLYQFWLHTQAIQRIPLVEGVFSTPSSHRVHHAKNPQYIDKNYGGTLVIWDRMFGTWQPELVEDRCHYGTTRPLDTFNPIRANLQHWQLLWQDSVYTKKWSDKLSLWFKPTGWRPEDCKAREGFSQLQSQGSSEREKFDPKTTPMKRAYAALSMLLTFAVAVMFVFLSPGLSGAELLLGSVLIVWGLVIANALLENRAQWWRTETLRVPALLWFASSLWLTPSTTLIVDTIEIGSRPEQVLDYAASVKRWPEWHPQSLHIYLDHKNALQTKEGFEEDISTPIGVQHMVWQVFDYQPGQHWIADAENVTNGALVRLEYHVTQGANEDSTSFERRLTYTLPNFFLVAANALYMKSIFEDKSEYALSQLRLAVEKERG